MRSKAILSLIYAQASFFLFLIVAILVRPGGFSNNRGLSFYGDNPKSAIPFGLGFICCDIFLLRAASLLPKHRAPFDDISRYIKLLCVFLILISLTPDSLDSLFDWGHIIDSSILFLFELIFASWLTFYWYHDKLTITFLVLELVGGLAAMFSQFHVVYYLSEGTLVFQAFFAILLIRITAKLLEKAGDANI